MGINVLAALQMKVYDVDEAESLSVLSGAWLVPKRMISAAINTHTHTHTHTHTTLFTNLVVQHREKKRTLN